MGTPTDRKWLIALYALLAVGGFATTWWNNVKFFTEPDSGGVAGYLEAALANPAAASLAFDVLFVGIAAQVFILVEGRRIGFSYQVLVGLVVAGALVAIAVSLPVFLLARQVRISGWPEARVPEHSRSRGF